MTKVRKLYGITDVQLTQLTLGIVALPGPEMPETETLMRLMLKILNEVAATEIGVEDTTPIVNL